MASSHQGAISLWRESAGGLKEESRVAGLLKQWADLD